MTPNKKSAQANQVASALTDVLHARITDGAGSWEYKYKGSYFDLRHGSVDEVGLKRDGRQTSP